MTSQLSPAAERFLEDRAIDVEAAVNLGLSSETGRGGGEILVFPFYRQGVAVNHKRRVLPKEAMWQDTGAPKVAWNEDCLRDDSLIGEPLVITEGELDAIAAIQCGFVRTISVPDGAPAPAKEGERSRDDLEQSLKYSWLQEIRPLLHSDRVSSIILAVDDDINGATLQQELSLQLGRARCKFVKYPMLREPAEDGRTRCKDLNEVLELYGARGVQETLANAKFFHVDGLFLMSELPEPPSRPVWEMPFNYPLLGENMRFRPGDVSVLTGIPNYGKTTFANFLWCALAERYGLRITWASFEQQAKPDHQRNLRHWYWNSEDPYYQGDVRAADAWIDEHHRFIIAPEDQDSTLERILELASASVIQKGSNVLVIDPWNEMEHIRPAHISMSEYIRDALRMIRRWALSHNSHVMVSAHPTKAVQVQDGSYRRPRMYDISDSAMWYNKADLGIVVHRPNKEETQIVVEKSRYHHVIGAPGEVFARFVPATLRYTELGRSSLKEMTDGSR